MRHNAPSISNGRGTLVRIVALALAAMALPACTIIPKGEGANGGGAAMPTPPPYTSPVEMPNPNPAPLPIPTPQPAPQPAPEPTPQPAPQAAPEPQPTPLPGMTAASLGVVSATLPRPMDQSARSMAALDSFTQSCPGLMRRTDQSGLTQAGDWDAACTEARAWPRATPADFFTTHFIAVQVGDGRAFATGYFEPEIAGVRDQQAGFDVPIYGKPADLVEQVVDGTRLRGKMVDGQFVQYDSRAEIENGSLSGRAPIIAWAASAPEFFFLQVQGSGRLRGPDGSIIRLNYAAGNGRPYSSIGKYMGQRGLLAPGQATMQGIVAYLDANPDEGRAIMQVNESYVFFAESSTGPMGAMGYPVTPQMSVAADPKFVPLGAPVVLNMDNADASGIWIAQDTGGAIKGANRFDTYWGAGERAATIAGGMAARGQAVVLIPKGAARRLGLIP